MLVKACGSGVYVRLGLVPGGRDQAVASPWGGHDTEEPTPQLTQGLAGPFRVALGSTAAAAGCLLSGSF